MVIVCIATQNWPCARQLILSQAFCLVFKMEQSSHVFDLETAEFHKIKRDIEIAARYSTVVRNPKV